MENVPLLVESGKDEGAYEQVRARDHPSYQVTPPTLSSHHTNFNHYYLSYTHAATNPPVTITQEQGGGSSGYDGGDEMDDYDDDSLFAQVYTGSS